MVGTILQAAEQNRNHYHRSTGQGACSIHSVWARCSPTLDEVIKAIKELKPNKAPGSDSITAEIYQYGGDTLTSCMPQLFIKLWEAAKLPQDLKDASILTIYKSKGDKRDCNNYHGISLLSVEGKYLAKIILRCLVSNITDNILLLSQCGFWSGHHTVDMIFAHRQLHEKCVEQQRSLYVTFVDLTKAFDTNDRDGLWKLLPKLGCTPNLTNIIQEFHEGMEGCINICGELSDQFPINNGVKQGCILAPTLFGLFFAAVLQDVTSGVKAGVFL